MAAETRDAGGLSADSVATGKIWQVIGAAVIAETGNIYAGLYYPMIVAAITFVVGSLLLRESNNVKIWQEVGADQARPTREAADDI